MTASTIVFPPSRSDSGTKPRVSWRASPIRVSLVERTAARIGRRGKRSVHRKSCLSRGDNRGSSFRSVSRTPLSLPASAAARATARFRNRSRAGPGDGPLVHCTHVGATKLSLARTALASFQSHCLLFLFFFTSLSFSSPSFSFPLYLTSPPSLSLSVPFFFGNRHIPSLAPPKQQEATGALFSRIENSRAILRDSLAN